MTRAAFQATYTIMHILRSSQVRSPLQMKNLPFTGFLVKTSNLHTLANREEVYKLGLRNINLTPSNTALTSHIAAGARETNYITALRIHH